jgi:long-chain acyl-CoA synthetase
MDDFGVSYFAAKNPRATALIDSRGTRWSRADLAALVDDLARALASAGLRPGDVVAVVSPNCVEYLGVCLAAIAAGLYVVPVNWHLADPEIAYLLENCGARAIVAHARLGAARCASLLAHGHRSTVRVSIGTAAGFVTLHDFVAEHSSSRFAEREPGRLMPYTSATTGRPKGVRRPLDTARVTLSKTVAWHKSFGIELEDHNVHLCTSMLYHVAPLEGAMIALEMGHTVVVADHSDAESLLRTIDEHRVTNLFMVPAMFVRLLKLPSDVRSRYSLASLRFVIHGGAPCPNDVKRRMIDWWGALVWESYGASEVQGTAASAAEWIRYPGTVGQPIAGSCLKVLDDAGDELPAGRVGNIYLTPFTGDRFEYLGDEAKTRACRRGDFVTVGDLGYVNGEGYLFVCGRRSELILCSGMNIYPAEIEQALVEHRDVADCAVVGMAHELFGEVPRAVVQPAPGVEPGSRLTFELLRFLGQRLAPMKLPHRIDYARELPRGPNGKLLRRHLSPDGEHGR